VTINTQKSGFNLLKEIPTRNGMGKIDTRLKSSRLRRRILSNYVDFPKVTPGQLTIIAEVMKPENTRFEERVYESS
jgi:hypothetical protein